jgi:hypothetical protein
VDEVGVNVGSEGTSSQREILAAVESWLVDPRREHRARPASRPSPADVQLDGDFSSFLAQHGLA